MTRVGNPPTRADRVRPTSPRSRRAVAVTRALDASVRISQAALYALTAAALVLLYDASAARETLFAGR